MRTRSEKKNQRMGGKKLTIIAMLALLLVATLISQPGCFKESDSFDIDWVNLIKFNDIMYDRKFVTLDSLAEEDLKYYDRVKFKLFDNVDDLDYRPKNGDAAYLEEGTLIYSIEGYSPDFRLVAKVGAERYLFEADTNPNATKGADLLDIGGKVEYIRINGGMDGITELASIKKKSLVSSLVEMVLNAPVDQTVRSSGGSQLFIAFHLDDGTMVSRSFRPDSGVLERGILLPDEFSRTIKSFIP